MKEFVFEEIRNGYLLLSLFFSLWQGHASA
jgi:hypothetical protein